MEKGERVRLDKVNVQAKTVVSLLQKEIQRV
jgi:hypothetical protein